MTRSQTNLTIESITQLDFAARSLLNFAGEQKIFLFYGNMGAGKTTFIKELCAQLGVKESVTSPTFSIVNEYEAGNSRVFHFDFYRLKNQEEALDMGYEEYFYSGDYCLIEWPEKISDLLPLNYTKVTIQADASQKRYFNFESI
ncbi:tRNA (adenosine(37)-N6)-threonylcarbamoyltransferase complex ATPase subunit type 1 TsaE [Mucilaginibacter aquatilis]|uniref:tRNA threonylcarbamoyladenosine biosynthesis protein TsaE n=1 Tax=Mucilaginibacter aquatilis TaxID=1517760 RepID=A0A6I4IE13_9SPHI|nr:tRNA (adenosine(37)-N6)-threonylcarbamoyltransferase complex ATPase subunit type 1 TsaE [Mucilaginibacter aquatilis]MVN92048.1 tRNA (adenosine(37)-N6)-threonylcarbamoyltransferase complex ATPase subunit type 1 TsaE [Mucilaginibacter aquatilis]